MLRSPNRRTAGFTLLELLVVISLITVLLLLTIGTYFKVRGTAEKRATEAMVEKLASAMDQHVKAIIDQAREEFQRPEQPPCSYVIGTINSIAQGDRRRAQAIYIKLRIRQELPQTFAEASSPVVIGATVSGPNPLFQAALPARPNYLRAVAGATAPVRNPLLRVDTENAACLFMALSVARRGVPAVQPESLGPNAATELPFGKQMRVFTDAWGSPISYCRWPVANSELGDTSNLDTQDSETLLYQRNPNNLPWINYLNATSGWGSNYNYGLLQFQLHTLTTHRHDGSQVTPHNLTPVIISAGMNRTLDCPNPPPTNPDPNLNPPFPPVPYRDYLDYYLMTMVDNAIPTGTGDDIVSFRLRKAGSRGD